MEHVSREHPLRDVTEIVESTLPRIRTTLFDESIVGGADEIAVTRTSFCGPVSGMVSSTLQNVGIECESIVADIKDLSTNNVHLTRHVVCRVWADGIPYILDATYAQFLRVFGMHFRHDIYANENLNQDLKSKSVDKIMAKGCEPHGGLPNRPTSVFPQEGYIFVPEANITEAGIWLAAVMRIFWQRHGYDYGFQRAHNYTHPDEWKHVICDIHGQPSLSEVEDFFSQLYAVDRYAPFIPSERLKARITAFSSLQK